MMNKQDMKKTQSVSVKVSMPDSLRAKFKAVCALKGTNMNETILKLIECWIKEENQQI